MKVKTIEVRGQSIEVHLNSDSLFTAELVSGQPISAPSMPELITKLEKATKVAAVKANIEFWRWKENKLMHGTLTGIHASNRNLLIKWDGVKGVEQEYGSRYSNPVGNYMRLAHAERLELEAMYAELDRAQKAVNAFEKAHSFDAPGELRAILKKAEEAA